MAGRTVQKWVRIYIDGYDMSGYTRSIPSLMTSFSENAAAALSDEINNSLPGQATISPGTLNAFLDNTATSGTHVITGDGTGTRTIMIPIGDNAEPADGVPAFVGQFEQLSYVADGADYINASVEVGNWSSQASTKAYEKAWGTLLHAKAAETAVNAANSGIGSFSGASTTKGGYLVYQVFSGDGTATISVEDSADNSAWAALSGATTGELDCSSVKHGLVALGTTATVRRYLRWQVSLNTATTVTFALAFVRA